MTRLTGSVSRWLVAAAAALALSSCAVYEPPYGAPAPYAAPAPYGYYAPPSTSLSLGFDFGDRGYGRDRWGRGGGWGHDGWGHGGWGHGGWGHDGWGHGGGWGWHHGRR